MDECINHFYRQFVIGQESRNDMDLFMKKENSCIENFVNFCKVSELTKIL